MNIIINYLTDLAQNNNREWYHANKKRYNEANAEFERFIGELIAAVGKFEGFIMPSR